MPALVLYRRMQTDAAGRTKEERQGDGSTSTLSCEGSSGRITGQPTENALGIVQYFGYDYNDVGSLASRADVLNGQSESFGYDNVR